MAIPAPESGFPHQVRHSNFLQTPLYSNKCQLRATFCPAIKKDVGISTDRQTTYSPQENVKQSARIAFHIWRHCYEFSSFSYTASTGQRVHEPRPVLRKILRQPAANGSVAAPTYRSWVAPGENVAQKGRPFFIESLKADKHRYCYQSTAAAGACCSQQPPTTNYTQFNAVQRSGQWRRDNKRTWKRILGLKSHWIL